MLGRAWRAVGPSEPRDSRRDAHVVAGVGLHQRDQGGRRARPAEADDRLDAADAGGGGLRAEVAVRGVELPRPLLVLLLNLPRRLYLLLVQ